MSRSQTKLLSWTTALEHRPHHQGSPERRRTHKGPRLLRPHRRLPKRPPVLRPPRRRRQPRPLLRRSLRRCLRGWCLRPRLGSEQWIPLRSWSRLVLQKSSFLKTRGLWRSVA